MSNIPSQIAKEIFISYSRKDVEKVKNIISWLEKNGISEKSFFFDQKNIDGAGVFPKVIANAISECKVLIFFISRSSIISDWVKNEVYYALKQRKAVLPVYLEDVKLDGDLDLPLSRIQQLNLFDGEIDDKYQAVLSSLVSLNITTQVSSPNNEINEPPVKFFSVKKFYKKHHFIIIILLTGLLFTSLFFWQRTSNNRNNTFDNFLKDSIKEEYHQQPNQHSEGIDSMSREKDNKLFSDDAFALFYSFHVKKKKALFEIFDDDTIHSGDKIQIRIRSSNDCYLYILNQDAGRNVYVLFPLSGYSNFLGGGNVKVIPDEGKYIVVDDQIGVERLYIVASLRAIKFLDDMILNYHPDRITQSGEINILDSMKSRGLSKVTEGDGHHIKKLNMDSEDFELDRFLKGKEILFKEISFEHN